MHESTLSKHLQAVSEPTDESAVRIRFISAMAPLTTIFPPSTAADCWRQIYTDVRAKHVMHLVEHLISIQPF